MRIQESRGTLCLWRSSRPSFSRYILLPPAIPADLTHWGVFLKSSNTDSCYQHDIAAAADAAVRKYREDTPPEDVTDDGVADAMKSSIRDSTDKLYKRLSKIVAVANPNLGVEWLQEVQYLTLPPL